MSDDMSPAQTAAAMHGLATNVTLPLEDRLRCALQALDFYSNQKIEVIEVKGVEVITGVPDDAPEAWKELVQALTLLAKGQVNPISPTHCGHDTLRVMADPHKFTKDELLKLDQLGFFVDGHETDEDGDEVQGAFENCEREYCDATFLSFKYGSA